MERTPALPEEVRPFKQELVDILFPDEPPGASAFGVPVPPSTPPMTRHIWNAGNVLGVGYGAKVTGGQPAENVCLRVYVRHKLPRTELTSGDLVPDQVAGLPTDVIQVGDVVAYRPVRCGVSIGHVDITAGTLGALLHTEDDDSPHILSNNHVLANVNQASIGDAILEPGPADGGTDPIAELTDFEPIQLHGPTNLMDAAIARVLDPADVLAEIETIGAVQNPPVEAALYQSVRKHGRTTKHTVGVVMDLSADLWVRVLPQANAWFEDQLVVVGAGGEFSQPGDSGSLVVDAVTKAPMALLFAGGQGHTFVNPIDRILTRFRGTVMTPVE